MKKIWGILVCVAIVLSCGAAAVFTKSSSVQSVRADSNPFDSTNGTFSIAYFDDSKIPSDKSKSLKDINYGDTNIVWFSEYEGCGSYVGTTGTFIMAFSVGRTLNQINPTSGSSWINVQYGSDINMANPTAVTQVSGELNVMGTTASNTTSAKFSIKFSSMGCYQITIHTKANGVATDTDLFFIVSLENPQIKADFPVYDNYSNFDGDRSTLSYYSNLFTAKSDPIALSFKQTGGRSEALSKPYIYQPSAPVIKKITYDKDGNIIYDPADATFLTATFVPKGATGVGSIDQWDFKLADGAKKAPDGFYSIKFRVKYMPFLNITPQGTILDPKVLVNNTSPAADAAYRDVEAIVQFKTGAPGTTFPVWTLFLCAGIILVLAGGYFGINYLIKRSEKQHARQRMQAQEDRAIIDRQNMERMRERTMPPPNSPPHN